MYSVTKLWISKGTFLILFSTSEGIRNGLPENTFLRPGSSLHAVSVEALKLGMTLVMTAWKRRRGTIAAEQDAEYSHLIQEDTPELSEISNRNIALSPGSHQDGDGVWADVEVGDGVQTETAAEHDMQLGSLRSCFGLGYAAALYVLVSTCVSQTLPPYRIPLTSPKASATGSITDPFTLYASVPMATLLASLFATVFLLRPSTMYQYHTLLVAVSTSTYILNNVMLTISPGLRIYPATCEFKSSAISEPLLTWCCRCLWPVAISKTPQKFWFQLW